MKKVVIAPDSFKGTMSSSEVCDIAEKAIKSVLPETTVARVPIADGGEGTVEAFLAALGGERVSVTVKGPLFDEIDSFYGILPDKKTAVIEMAAASGLTLTGGRLDPLQSTTYGTGQLILDALDKNCSRIILGLGGSATNDGGVGMAAALGVRFLDGKGAEIGLNGGGLVALSRIDVSRRDPRLDGCEIIVACDVDNTLCGKEGASYVFGPQKGADENTVRILDANLSHYSDILYRELGIQVRDIPGTGAAGGMPASLLAFTVCSIKPGITIILDTVGFDTLIEDADLIITGEGRIDGQSLRGKAPLGIAARAEKYHVPVIAVVGSIGNNIDAVYECGIKAVFSTGRRPVPFEEARLTCREDLFHTVENIFRFYRACKAN